MKRGLIYPRSSMQNAWSAQGLPQIYSRLAPYLKMCFDFSEGTGGKLYDKSGNGIIATLNSGLSGDNASLSDMWVNGKPGGVGFDGVNDYGEISSSQLSKISSWLDIGKPSTVIFWIEDLELPSYYDRIFASWDYDSGGSGGSQHFYFLRKYDTQQRTGLWLGNGNYSQRTGLVMDSVGDIPGLNIPYCLAVTWDGGLTSSAFNIYVNSSIQACTGISGTLANNSIYDNDHSFGFAASDRGGDDPGDWGGFSNMVIYSAVGLSKVLTADEFSALYNYERRYFGV